MSAISLGVANSSAYAGQQYASIITNGADTAANLYFGKVYYDGDKATSMYYDPLFTPLNSLGAVPSQVTLSTSFFGLGLSNNEYQTFITLLSNVTNNSLSCNGLNGACSLSQSCD